VSRGSLLLKLELRSDPAMLCVVRNALGQLAETLGFSEAECRAIVLAVAAAATGAKIIALFASLPLRLKGGNICA